MTKKNLLIVGVALVVLGVLAFVLQPGPPDAVCAPAGATATSGSVDSESGCAITIESMQEIREYESSPKPLRIVGLILIVAGLGVGVFGAVRRPRQTGPPTA